MMVTWHVDNLKVSHTDPFQISKFATYLATIYGSSLVVDRRPVRDYIGMDLNISQPGITHVKRPQ
jgi:hypothetical protein